MKRRDVFILLKGKRTGLDLGDMEARRILFFILHDLAIPLKETTLNEEHGASSSSLPRKTCSPQISHRNPSTRRAERFSITMSSNSAFLLNRLHTREGSFRW